MKKRQRVKITTVQINATVGAFRTNTYAILDQLRYIETYETEPPTFIVFPECALSGYSPEELVSWPAFQRNQLPYVREIVDRSATQKGHPIILVGGTFDFGGTVMNVIYVMWNGTLIGIIPKDIGPEYNVFFDGRIFDRKRRGKATWIQVWEDHPPVPFGDIVFQTPFTVFGGSVCEDIWIPHILAAHAQVGVEIELNCSASPFRCNVPRIRYEMLATRSADSEMIIAYTSLVGGQGGIVYDGDGYTFRNGIPLNQSPRWLVCFQSAVIPMDAVRSRRTQNTTYRVVNSQTTTNDSLPVVIPLEMVGYELPPYKQGVAREGRAFMPTPRKATDPTTEFYEDLEKALVLGIGDYFEKTRAFKRIAVNSSGGKDSALVIILAWIYAQQRFGRLDPNGRAKAIKDFLWTFSWPTRFNSGDTKNAARELSEHLGITFHEVSIEEEYLRELALIEKLTPGENTTKTHKGNIQARLRGMRLRNFCNVLGAMMLNTSNMAEKSVGYGTKGGADLDGDLGVITNAPKGVVIGLLRYLGQKYDIPVTEIIIDIVASAELAENQSDEHDLMPYEVLEECLDQFVGLRLSQEECIEIVIEKFGPWGTNQYDLAVLEGWVKKFVRLFFQNIHKWVGTPEGIHLFNTDLDRERAMHLPTVSNDEWLQPYISAG